MAEPHIDVKEVQWFAGHEPVTLGEPCDHACKHRMLRVVAWGPTRQTYELIRCDECGCHAWEDMRVETERRSRTGDGGFWRRLMEWRKPS